MFSIVHFGPFAHWWTIRENNVRINIYCLLKKRERVMVELSVAKRPRPKGSLYGHLDACIQNGKCYV